MIPRIYYADSIFANNLTTIKRFSRDKTRQFRHTSNEGRFLFSLLFHCGSPLCFSSLLTMPSALDQDHVVCTVTNLDENDFSLHTFSATKSSVKFLFSLSSTVQSTAYHKLRQFATKYLAVLLSFSRYISVLCLYGFLLT